MFGFSIVKPPFSFTNVKSITIPAICSVNNSGCCEQCMYFENACIAHAKRQVIIKMNKFNMFITAVCVLVLNP